MIVIREFKNVASWLYPENRFVGDGMVYGRLEPKRPNVKRKGDTVQLCFFYKGMKECLGVRCFWPRVGVCPIYNKLKAKGRARAK